MLGCEEFVVHPGGYERGPYLVILEVRNEPVFGGVESVMGTCDGHQSGCCEGSRISLSVCGEDSAKGVPIDHRFVREKGSDPERGEERSHDGVQAALARSVGLSGDLPAANTKRAVESGGEALCEGDDVGLDQARGGRVPHVQLSPSERAEDPVVAEPEGQDEYAGCAVGEGRWEWDGGVDEIDGACRREGSDGW